MSQIIEIKVPDIGDYKDVPVIEVLVKAGDKIEKEQSIVVLESDKATMDVPSSHSGVVKEVKVKVEEIRKVKKEKKVKALQLELEKPKMELKLGDRVRMIDGKAVGTLDTIEKNKAVVNYGLFTSKVSLDQLEFVERPKK